MRKFSGKLLSKDGSVYVPEVNGDMDDQWTGELTYDSAKPLGTAEYTLVLDNGDSGIIVFDNALHNSFTGSRAHFNRVRP